MSRHQRAFLLTVVAAFFWGSSFSMVKVGLDYIDPYLFVFMRFAIASGILSVMCIVLRKLPQVSEVLRDPYVITLAGVNALAFVLQFRGQVETTAANAAMIINSSAALVAPLAIIFLKEVISKKQVVALPIGMTGVYLIVSSGSDVGLANSRITGDLLVLISAVLYALYIVVTRMIMIKRAYGGLVLVTGIFLWSLPLFALISALATQSYDIPSKGLAISSYLAIFCSIIPFILWVDAIRHLSALTSAIALLSELVFAVVIAVLLLGERLTSQSITGCILISLALLMLGHSEAAIQSR